MLRKIGSFLAVSSSLTLLSSCQGAGTESTTARANSAGEDRTEQLYVAAESFAKRCFEGDLISASMRLEAAMPSREKLEKDLQASIKSSFNERDNVRFGQLMIPVSKMIVGRNPECLETRERIAKLFDLTASVNGGARQTSVAAIHLLKTLPSGRVLRVELAGVLID